MADNKTSHTDEGLQDNEQIEQAILALQQQPSQEMLAHALTVLRRRMFAHGQLIVAVEPPVGDNQMRLQAIRPMTVKNGGQPLPVLMKKSKAVAA